MIITIVICAVLIGLDQFFKYLAVHFLAGQPPVTVIPGVLQLCYVENDGAAFSILSGQQTLLIILTGITLLIVAYILLFRRPKQKLEYVALLMIFSGGMGNLVNRIASGYVVDYLNPLFMQFAVFNFADCLVTVGVALFVLGVILSEVRAYKEKKSGQLVDAGDTAKDKQAEQHEALAAEPDEKAVGDVPPANNGGAKESTDKAPAKTEAGTNKNGTQADETQ